MVPDELSEWHLWAQRLWTASPYYKDDFKDAASKLPEETVRELGQFYEKIVASGGLARLNVWLESVRNEVPMSPEQRGIRNLVSLFCAIGDWWGWRPFTTNALAPHKLVAPEPDWSKLPPGTRFLAEPAEWSKKFSYVFSEEGRDYIRKNITADERAMLAETTKRIRNFGYRAIDAWVTKLGVSDHVEPSLVFHLFGVLGALGFNYAG